MTAAARPIPLVRSSPISLRGPAKPDPQRAERARTSAQQLVATGFLQPLLAQARATSIAEGPFAPGDGERRFGPLLDRILADSVTRASNFKLVDAVEGRLLAPTPVRPQAPSRALPLVPNDAWHRAAPHGLRIDPQPLELNA